MADSTLFRPYPRAQLWLRLLLPALLCLTLHGCGGSSGGDEDNTPSPSPEPPNSNLPQLLPDIEPDPPLPERGTPEWEEATEAARLLTQTTFGPTAKTVVEVMEKGRDAWLDEQFSTPATPHLALLDARFEELGWIPAPQPERDDEGYLRDLQRSDVWWEMVLRGEDQLRQRVAYALSQIFVISNVSDVLYNDTRGIASYHDMLAGHAFGNYRDLLEDVTLHPMMGEYLSMVRNEKANEENNIRPDENYAREVMQLFSIGLEELNPDGSVKTDVDDEPIPTYNQDTIKAFARVFTGWNFNTANAWWEWTSDSIGETQPMKAFQEIHDMDEKQLLNGGILPAWQTAEQDMDMALDNIFNHPNVGPFISKQLIQRLITSNPSPAYVARVAAVFNNNGDGERGDLGAVVRAIIDDEEARTGHLTAPETFGKLREPVLQFSNLWRTFKAHGVSVRDESETRIVGQRIRFRGSDREAGQRPYGSFSVFNFYRPGYSHPGPINQAGLLAPEFQIHTESVVIAKTNHLVNSIFWRDMDVEDVQDQVAGHNWDVYPPQLNLREEKALAGNVEALIDRLDLLLTSGQLDADTRQLLVDHVNTLPLEDANEYHRILRVFEAGILIVASPHFAVQR